MEALTNSQKELLWVNIKDQKTLERHSTFKLFFEWNYVVFCVFFPFLSCLFDIILLYLAIDPYVYMSEIKLNLIEFDHLLMLFLVFFHRASQGLALLTRGFSTACGLKYIRGHIRVVQIKRHM